MSNVSLVGLLFLLMVVYWLMLHGLYLGAFHSQGVVTCMVYTWGRFSVRYSHLHGLYLGAFPSQVVVTCMVYTWGCFSVRV
jgi:hypothetical protein